MSELVRQYELILKAAKNRLEEAESEGRGIDAATQREFIEDFEAAFAGRVKAR